MQTGMISFCDRIAMNIKSNDVKSVILNDLEQKFHVRIMAKHWHKLDEVSCNHIKQNPHFMSLRSNGNPYYMYFTTYDDVPIIYYIDKKVASGYTYPRIILGRGLFHPDVFQNTLLDGEMVKRGDGGWTFLINDIYAYHNQWLENYHLPYRLAYAATIFQKEHMPDPVLDTCRFEIKTIVPAGPGVLDQLLLLASKLTYTNRGIYFWPTIMKQKPKLFNFDESLILEVKPKIKETTEFRMAGSTVEPAIPTPQSVALSSAVAHTAPPAIEDGLVVMNLQRTEFPDVYNVFAVGQKAKDGIAHISNLKTSKLLHDIFKHLNIVTSVQFYCKKHISGKWSPIRQVGQPEAVQVGMVG